MSHPDYLIGFTLSTVGGSINLKRTGIAYHFQAVPEGGGDGAIIRVSHRPGQFTVLDQFALFTPKLEFIPVIVDRPGTI